jgi:YHYH protein
MKDIERSGQVRLGTLALFCGVSSCSLSAGSQTPIQPGVPVVVPTQLPGIASRATTGNVLCGISHTEYNPTASVRQTASYGWSCNGSSRILNANGLPNHDVGTFPGPGNPNPIAAVQTTATYTLNPERTGHDTAVVTSGYALNGVKLEPSTAGSCDDSGRDCRMARSNSPWRLEALGQSSFNFGTDESNGHVQPNGAYHYHGLPERLIAKLAKGSPSMTLVAWAPDGFPVYARHGHSVANDAQSPIVVMRSSFRLKVAPDNGRPSPNQFSMGTFTQDYEYVAGSGDLDECNGRSGVTPEFPRGIYHYVMTETFPFINRCVKGTAASLR